MEKVLYVPTLHTNLFSSGVVTERGMVVIEDQKGCKVMKNGNVIAVGVKQGRMYKMLFKVVLPDKSMQANITTSVKKLSIRIWHER